MRKYLTILLISFSTCIWAQSSGFGAGLILGEPTGISLKGWLSKDRAIDGAVAWSFWHSPSFRVHADYLFHNMDLIKLSKGKLPLYFGPGVRLLTWTGGEYREHGRWVRYEGSRVDLGVRFPVGLDYLPVRAPVDVFLEVVPTLDLLPSTSFDFDAAIGVRYWF